MTAYRSWSIGRERNAAFARCVCNRRAAPSSTGAGNIFRGSIVTTRRPRRRGVGDGRRKLYESTFALSPGWDRSLETDRWRDYVRSDSDNWPKVGDVYRKWVLSEHGLYGQTPWELDTYTFQEMPAGEFPLVRPRHFMPCLSADSAGRSLGIVVEINCDDQGWRRWQGAALSAADECAIRLGGDALPGEYFDAAVRGEVQVRVTATVEADAR